MRPLFLTGTSPGISKLVYVRWSLDFSNIVNRMRDFNDLARPPPRPVEHRKELVKLITALAPRHTQWQVFSDFVEMTAIALSNAVDLAQREKREARYMEIVKRYRADEVQKFPEMFAALTLALEAEMSDVLGSVFHELELHSKWAGQFFSPYNLCRMMGKMTLGGKADLESRILQRGFVTTSEPAAGSGAMVIALAHEMEDAGIDYQQHLHVTAVDVDAKCVHMAYLQLSLLHVPAVVVHGNSLSLEEYAHWHTPAHILGGWSRKLASTKDPPEIVPVPVPSSRHVDTEDKHLEPMQLKLF